MTPNPIHSIRLFIWGTALLAISLHGTPAVGAPSAPRLPGYQESSSSKSTVQVSDEDREATIKQIKRDFRKGVQIARKQLRFKEAAKVLRAAVAQAEQVLDNDDPDLVHYHEFLANVLIQTNETGDAIKECQRAMEFVENIPNFPIARRTQLVATYLRALNRIANYPLAVSLARKQINLIETTAPDQEFALASMHHLLGDTFMTSTRYQEALTSYKKADELYRKRNMQQGPQFEDFLRNYSAAASETADHQNALTLINRSIELYKNRLGEKKAEQSFLTMFLAEKASILQKANRFDESSQLCKRIIEIQNRKESKNLITLLRANNIQAGNQLYSGQMNATRFLNESIEYARQDFMEQVPTLNLNQIYHASIDFRNQTNSIHRMVLPTSQEMVKNAFDQTSRFKGCGFRIITNRARAKIAEPKDAAIPGLGAIRDQLANSLGENDVAIDIQQGKRDYYAFVVTRDEHGLTINHIRLGNINYIDNCISEFVDELRSNPGPAKEKKPLDPVERGVESIVPELRQGEPAWGDQLKQMIWQSLTPYFGDRKNVLICGDGKLALFPWSALPATPGDYLARDYCISTETDLVALTRILGQKSTPIQQFAGVAGIRYSIDSNDEADKTPKKTRFQFLPGSTKEIELAKAAFQNHGRDTRLVSGKKVNEASIKKELVEGTVLHVATHGAFLGNVEGASRPGNWYRAEHLSESPIRRSVLALSGVNEIQSDQIQGVSDDGWLSGDEVLRWDLRNIPLVVLSSCEGAVGEIRFSEGVYGIQRSFRSAGAQATLVSLWSVSDKNAPIFFNHFYQHLMKGVGKAEALRQAKLEMIKLDIPPRHWAGWVLSGDRR